ncbi:3-isopropylmalate dehydratase small subunit [Bacillus salipaludis]|uniref:3-isopropylmalate dehydratase small subunit n=1 Tax=Bacillus salipaludis TaxID=2547811 RepID=UPI003D25F9DA
MQKIKGKTWVFPDNVDTDMINPGRYLKLSADQAAKHIFEGIDPDFPSKFEAGDIIVAGKNFGCGSSRESAPAAIKLSGISAIISVFFARIFFRNAINLGLPVIECKEATRIEEGNEIEIDFENGVIYNLTKNESYSTTIYPPYIQEIINHGGLVNMLEQKLSNKEIKL